MTFVLSERGEGGTSYLHTHDIKFPDIDRLQLQQSVETEITRDCFFSYAWGTDNVTHSRVKSIVDEFTTRGRISCWFDKERMQEGDYMFEEMAKGIAESRFAVIFITQNYLDKIYWHT
jgi:hypothetical protein